MEVFRSLLVERPGMTPVYVHVPTVDGLLSIQLRGVAYDAGFVAEVGRWLSGDLVELNLAVEHLH